MFIHSSRRSTHSTKSAPLTPPIQTLMSQQAFEAISSSGQWRSKQHKSYPILKTIDSLLTDYHKYITLKEPVREAVARNNNESQTLRSQLQQTLRRLNESKSALKQLILRQEYLLLVQQEISEAEDPAFPSLIPSLDDVHSESHTDVPLLYHMGSLLADMEIPDSACTLQEFVERELAAEDSASLQKTTLEKALEPFTTFYPNLDPEICELFSIDPKSYKYLHLDDPDISFSEGEYDPIPDSSGPLYDSSDDKTFELQEENQQIALTLLSLKNKKKGIKKYMHSLEKPGGSASKATKSYSDEEKETLGIYRFRELQKKINRLKKDFLLLQARFEDYIGSTSDAARYAEELDEIEYPQEQSPPVQTLETLQRGLNSIKHIYENHSIGDLHQYLNFDKEIKQMEQELTRMKSSCSSAQAQYGAEAFSEREKYGRQIQQLEKKLKRLNSEIKGLKRQKKQNERKLTRLAEDAQKTSSSPPPSLARRKINKHELLLNEISSKIIMHIESLQKQLPVLENSLDVLQERIEENKHIRKIALQETESMLHRRLEMLHELEKKIMEWHRENPVPIDALGDQSAVPMFLRPIIVLLDDINFEHQRIVNEITSLNLSIWVPRDESTFVEIHMPSPNASLLSTLPFEIEPFEFPEDPFEAHSKRMSLNESFSGRRTPASTPTQDSIRSERGSVSGMHHSTPKLEPFPESPSSQEKSLSTATGEPYREHRSLIRQEDEDIQTLWEAVTRYLDQSTLSLHEKPAPEEIPAGRRSPNLQISADQKAGVESNTWELLNTDPIGFRSQVNSYMAKLITTPKGRSLLREMLNLSLSGQPKGQKLLMLPASQYMLNKRFEKPRYQEHAQPPHFGAGITHRLPLNETLRGLPQRINLFPMKENLWNRNPNFRIGYRMISHAPAQSEIANEADEPQTHELHFPNRLSHADYLVPVDPEHLPKSKIPPKKIGRRRPLPGTYLSIQPPFIHFAKALNAASRSYHKTGNPDTLPEANNALENRLRKTWKLSPSGTGNTPEIQGGYSGEFLKRLDLERIKTPLRREDEYSIITYRSQYPKANISAFDQGRAEIAGGIKEQQILRGHRQRQEMAEEVHRRRSAAAAQIKTEAEAKQEIEETELKNEFAYDQEQERIINIQIEKMLENVPEENRERMEHVLRLGFREEEAERKNLRKAKWRVPQKPDIPTNTLCELRNTLRQITHEADDRSSLYERRTAEASSPIAWVEWQKGVEQTAKREMENKRKRQLRFNELWKEFSFISSKEKSRKKDAAALALKIEEWKATKEEKALKERMAQFQEFPFESLSDSSAKSYPDSVASSNYTSEESDGETVRSKLEPRRKKRRRPRK